MDKEPAQALRSDQQYVVQAENERIEAIERSIALLEELEVFDAA